MDRYEISLMTFMALWWLFNVVSVWLKAKKWHINGITIFFKASKRPSETLQPAKFQTAFHRFIQKLT